MKLLLHACCGPCSLEPVRLLQEAGHDITICFANANIQPREEYDLRLDTLRAWAAEEDVPVVDLPYDLEGWQATAGAVEAAGGSREDRCRACYAQRLEAAAAWGAEHGFEALSTTLAVSPYQLSDVCREELEAAAARHGMACIWEDFRPYYSAATTRSRELGMYRQNYCGCLYSKAEADAERAERKVERAALKKRRKLKTADFDYELPEAAIAQEPWPVRDECKLLVMERATGALEDKIFRDIVHYLEPGDVLVANETRVLPARLLGSKRETGGEAEVFLLREVLGREAHTAHSAVWEALVRPGKRLKPGAVVDFFASDAASPAGDKAEPILSAEVLDFTEEGKGERIVRLTTPLTSLDEAMHTVGHTPLPPYIHDYAGDEEMYQTVYARRETSAAAPTAGLHFTPELIAKLQDAGVIWKTVELQVGIDTFRIVEEESPADHAMHTETYSVPQDVVDAANTAHAAGKRVIAVGTTSVRSLESAWDLAQGKLIARDNASTNLFLTPGSEFHVVDGIITNFHVPRSTLMMLVSAFSTRDHIMGAYQHALESDYRFLSFGDAMFIA